MASHRLRRAHNAVSFRCPGCKDVHTVPVEGAWGWNQSLTRPTLTPSLLVRSGHYAPHHKPGDPCWCGKGYSFSCYQCHSVITNGKIAFQGDCSHELAGQTVDLPDIGADPG